MLSIVSGGPGNVEDHLLVVQPWQEQLPHFFMLNFGFRFGAFILNGTPEALVENCLVIRKIVWRCNCVMNRARNRNSIGVSSRSISCSPFGTIFDWVNRARRNGMKFLNMKGSPSFSIAAVRLGMQGGIRI